MPNFTPTDFLRDLHISSRVGIFAIIFSAAMIGALSRPLFFLASFWPANALLLGLILRFPQLRGIETWLGAFAGFFIGFLFNAR